MIAALWLLVAQSVLGAFDTLYFHEWRARLPGNLPGTAPELLLHGARDLIYAIIFGTLAFLRGQGLFAVGIAVLLATEIVITLRDFVIEDTVRRPLGGVYPGERLASNPLPSSPGMLRPFCVFCFRSWRQVCSPQGFET